MPMPVLQALFVAIVMSALGCRPVDSYQSVYQRIDVAGIPYARTSPIDVSIGQILRRTDAGRAVITAREDLDFVSRRVRDLPPAIVGCADVRIVALCRRVDGEVDTLTFGGLTNGFNGGCYWLDSSLVVRIAKYLPDDHLQSLSGELSEIGPLVQEYIDTARAEQAKEQLSPGQIYRSPLVAIALTYVDYQMNFASEHSPLEILSSASANHGMIGRQPDLSLIDNRLSQLPPLAAGHCGDTRIVGLCYRKSGRIDTLAFGGLFNSINGECHFLDTTLILQVSQYLYPYHRAMIRSFVSANRLLLQANIDSATK